MKKITFLFAVILLSFSGVAQETEKTEIDWEAFRLTVRKASAEAVQETNDRLGNRYAELFKEADREFHRSFPCPCFSAPEKPNKYLEAARKAKILTDQKYFIQKSQD